MGRNLVTNLTGDEDYNHYLRAHETGHFAQQREMGFGKFYGRTALEYLRYGFLRAYGTTGTLEFLADRYSLIYVRYVITIIAVEDIQHIKMMRILCYILFIVCLVGCDVPGVIRVENVSGEDAVLYYTSATTEQ